MADTRTGPEPGRITWRTRAFVLAGLVLALLATGGSLAAGAGADHLAPLWLAALAWTVVASLGMALGRGVRHRDWSAFRRVRLPDGRDERIDWISKTGAYAYLRIRDEHERWVRDDAHLR